MLQLLLREAFRRRETWMWPRGSRWVSECVPGICILWDTHGCRGTRAENSGRFTAIMVFLFSRTATRISSVRTLSTFTPCVSRRVNCGASKPHRKIPFTLTCGTTTLSQPSLTKGPESLAALPRLPRDEGGPVFAEPWQAQAFALAVELSEHGHFTWKEWSTALADELKVAASRGEPDDGSQHSSDWWWPKGSLIRVRCLPGKMLGPTPTGIRPTASLWSYPPPERKALKITRACEILSCQGEMTLSVCREDPTRFSHQPTTADNATPTP